METKATDSQKSLRDLGELVTVKQVADAAQVCRGTVYEMIARGDLKAVKLRGAIRLNRDEVCRYLGL